MCLFLIVCISVFSFSLSFFFFWRGGGGGEVKCRNSLRVGSRPSSTGPLGRIGYHFTINL